MSCVFNKIGFLFLFFCFCHYDRRNNFCKRLTGVFFNILIHVSVIVKMQHISFINANTLFGNKQCKNILMKLYLKQLIKFTRN